MPLEDYAEKRDLGKTPEPGVRVPTRAGPLLFTIQKHDATRLHYDLRLELDGVLKSWAVPKGLSLDPADKHLAVMVEDHPFDYMLFEGVIPEGNYGAGEVVVWDAGVYQPDEPPSAALGTREEQQAHVRKALADGKLSFRLRGQKCKGSWALVRMKDEPNWLLFKHHDGLEAEGRDLQADGRSAISGLTIEDLQAGRLPPDGHHLRTVEAAEAEDPFPAKLAPMLAVPAEKAFVHEDWFFEPKLDGVRALAVVKGAEVQLVSRYGNDVGRQFPEVVAALARQGLRDTILDGEIVAFGEDGRPSWYETLRRLKQENEFDIQRESARAPCAYFPFDLVRLEGVDLARCRLDARKLKLGQVLLPDPRISPVAHVSRDGATLYQAALAAGFEGMVAKRASSRYEMGKRSDAWLKIKPRQSAEFIVGGLTDGEGSRKSTFGALMLGVWEEGGRLNWVGNVGSGFDDETLRDLDARLRALAQPECPFDPPPPTKGVWVTPTQVAEVAFAEWGPTGVLRQPVFMRMRDDADPAAAVAVQVEAATAPAPHRASADELLEQLASPKANLTLDVEGCQIALSNLDKVYWPSGPALEAPVTKRDFLRYLAAVGEWMIPHLRDRPLTMIRMPEGIHGERFYQKHWEASRPDFVETVDLYSESAKRDAPYVMVNNLPTLLWLGQVGCLEFHVMAARYAKEPDGAHLGMEVGGSAEAMERSILNYPDFLCFDLDPYTYSGEEKEGDEPELNRAGFHQAVIVAKRLKELVEQIGLSVFVKTTGKTGLHVFAPIQRTMTFDETRALCGTLCQFVVREMPEVATVEWQTGKRTGRVFLDYNMNARSKNLGAAFSPRATPGAWVSMPLTWDELETAYPADFGFDSALAKTRERGDPWAGILSTKQLIRL